MKQIQLAREIKKKILDNFIALIANFNATLKKKSLQEVINC